MDFRFLFLEPQGRLAPKPFARGLVLLTGVNLIFAVVSTTATKGFGPLQLALIFPFFCLFAKRLHDAGFSAWLWLVFLMGFGFANIISTALLFPVLSPQAFAMQDEVQTIMLELLKGGSTQVQLEAYVERMDLFSRLSAVTSVASLLVASGLTGFAAYSMRSERTPNRHGPPTGAPRDLDNFS